MHKTRYLSVSSLAVLVSAAADGAIVHNTNSIAFGPDNTIGWDIDGDTVMDASATALDTVNGFAARLYGNNSAFGVKFVVTGSDGPATLSAGITVNTALFTSVYQMGYNAIFQFNNVVAPSLADDTSAYIGFIFFLNDSVEPTFGWARMTPDLDNNLYTIHEWAYEDSGNSIQVGAVPEPAETAVGLGALALGAAGLRRWRKQRKAA